MVSDAVVDWAVILGAAFSAVTIIIVTANFALTHIKTPRSKIRLDQLSDDACVVDSGDDSNWLTLRWDFTAINDGKRDGNLTDPVFEDATFHAGGRSELVTPDDLGRGSTYIMFREKEEEKVASLSNDKIRIDHQLSKSMGIHEYISEYDTMTFRYSVMVEDGVTPYKADAEGMLDISGLTIRWNETK